METTSAIAAGSVTGVTGGKSGKR
ncbi:hypothetical protein ACW5W8_03615 [Aeromonas aquatilis]